MANPSKRKGDNAEREIAQILTDRLGYHVRRKLGAGRSDDAGDLDGIPDTAVQVKNYSDITRAIREGLESLEIQQRNALADHGVLFVRRPGGRWIAVMTVDQWCTLRREAL